ncbi:hypothetical protein, partial [Parafrankia discariae]|uniref:hypothetical protein n=1 Tax=Parafrankia discariae TaxID=365528 RepID=UPI0018A86AFC
MTSKIGRRTAILATSGLVSVAVTLGAGATSAQALVPGGGPEVKKESKSLSYERVVWYDGKDKKHHKEKEKPYSGSESDD